MLEQEHEPEIIETTPVDIMISREIKSNSSNPIDPKILEQLADPDLQKSLKHIRLWELKTTLATTALSVLFVLMGVIGAKVRSDYKQTKADKAEIQKAKIIIETEKRVAEDSKKGQAERDKLIAEFKAAIKECMKVTNDNHFRWDCLSKKLGEAHGYKSNLDQKKLQELAKTKKEARQYKASLQLLIKGIQLCDAKNHTKIAKGKCIRNLPYMKKAKPKK